MSGLPGSPGSRHIVDWEPMPLARNGSGLKRRQERLLREIEAEVRETCALTGRCALAERVMDALAEVPRHEFVPPGQAHLAYEDRPLSIGCGQTISQPYIVALMTDLLGLTGDEVVLEVGTGSGYQAAILAKLAKKVHTIERVRSLANRGRERLERLGFDNVEVHRGDGYHGLKEHAPFDAVIVTAAAEEIPKPLVEQLKGGGRMAIPLGSRFMVQELVLVKKDESGKVATRPVLPVEFVPLKSRR